MPTRALVLGIETSNPSAWELSVPVRPGVAVVEFAGTGAARVLAVEEIDPARPHDDDLVPAIDRALRAAGLGPGDLARVAVSAGPGGFTAVRMAVTAAKSIADVLGIELVLVPSTHSAAAAAVGRGRTAAVCAEPFAVAVASKEETAWGVVFDAHGGATNEGRLMGADELVQAGVRTVAADRFLPASMRAAAMEAGMKIVTPVFDPVACAAASAGLPAADPAAAAPMYPRPPEAVRKWEEVQARKAQAKKQG